MSGLDNNMEVIVSFAESAKEYCSFIESIDCACDDDFEKQLEKMLAKLHSTIIQVDKSIVEYTVADTVECNVSYSCYTEVKKSVSLKINSKVEKLLSYHLEISDGKYDDNLLRVDMLSDDLADIYKDIKNGLLVWENRGSNYTAEAVWLWRFNFEVHWGNHLYRAMQTIHEMLYLV